MTEFSGSGSLDQGLNEGANPGSPPSGGGDMYRYTYDTDNDGVVDDAERLNGQLPAYYATATDLATALAAAVAAQSAITAHAALANNPHSTTLEQARAAANAILGIIRGSGLSSDNVLDLNNTDYGTPGSVLKSSNAVVVVQDGRILLTDLASLAGIYVDTVALTAQLFNDYGSFTLNADGTLDAANSRILNIGAPSAGGDAVNKNYADALIVGLEATANKNQNNGYAGLDNNGLIPSTLLPSYVDDVLEYANLASFPVTGVSEKVYVALDTFKTYRWSGSVYVEISPSPGSTDDVPEGAVNKYFQESRVLSTVLAGLSLATNAVISAADSVLSALGKLQAQITANLATLTSHTSNTSNPHSVTKSQVGLSNVPNTDTTNPANISQSSSYRFVTDSEKSAWNSATTDSRDGKLYGSHSQSLCASTGSDEVLYAIALPAMSTGTILEFIMQMRCTSSANNKTYKAWMNTTGDLSGSPVQIATLTATTNAAAATFQRRYGVRSSTSIISAYAATTSFSNPYATSTVLPTEITGLPSMASATYLVISCNRANAGDVAGSEWINVKISR